MTTHDLRRAFTRKSVFVCAVFFLFFCLLVWPVNFYLARTLKGSYYQLLAPVLVCLALQFPQLRRSPEGRVMLLYCLWFWFSRILCGDPALATECEAVLDLFLMIPFVAFGLVLDREERRRALNWVSAVVGGVFFVYGALGLAAYMQHTRFSNPITQGELGVHALGEAPLLNILNFDPNTCGVLFVLAALLMLYQFAACKNRLWRVPIALAGLVHLLAACVTFSRSALLVLSLALACAAVSALLPVLRARRPAVRIASLAVVFLLVLALSFKLTGWGGDALLRLSYTLYPYQPPAIESTEAPEAEEEAAVVVSAAPSASPDSPLFRKLDSLSTGRLSIWRFALQACRQEPLSLLRGHLMKDVTVGFDSFVTEEFLSHYVFPTHMHNSLVQVLLSMGLPGFALALVMFFLIVRSSLRCFVAADARTGLPTRLLASIPLAAFVYFLLEPWLFLSLDTCAFTYYILWGLVAGEARDLSL